MSRGEATCPDSDTVSWIKAEEVEDTCKGRKRYNQEKKKKKSQVKEKRGKK